MKVQHYKNHIRYYPPHHFVFYPVVLLLEGFAIYRAITNESLRELWVFIALIVLLVAWLSYMTRQHYALQLQDRLVRLEMRHKYAMLTGKDFEPQEQKLSFGQIAALRFASDDELVPLINKAIKENLPPKAIKQMIRHWKADYMRV
ncbi:hypothetical protein A8C56_09975 [Niabella ginsenosidivorans]|uniref:Uncharacterized protein n=1 Tax=Niabella ginsenosidivorans TaxID=1176587 RepID=A0A1A9I2I0_9BACT|nr:DUF6526 family protein [Niabella ginsenosidivorans]ANH81269.1 hypothetical protein A8C56_09975 [Niabella ginsenosidivorans]